jgi:O-antigen ligase
MRSRQSTSIRGEKGAAGIGAHPMADFYALKPGALWNFFRKEHFSFWAICGYMIIEYVRPQMIFRQLDILPWAKLFLALSLVSWLLDRKSRWVSDPTNKWMVIYLLVIILASYTAYFPEISHEHFMDFFGWFVIYFLIINIVNSEKRFFIILLLFMLASFKMSFHGARTWAMRGFVFTSWGLMGPEGYFQNSGELAIQMLMFTPIAYQFVVGIKPWLTPIKYYILMSFPVTGAMTIIGASTRGGQIALAVQVFKTFLWGRISFKTILLCTLISVGGWMLVPEEQKLRFTEAGEDETSRQRLLYWQRGVEMIGDNPVLGVGYFNFAPYFAKYYPEDIILGMGRAELPHNIFVQVGTDAGIVGLSVYLMLIYRGFRSTSDVRRLVRDKKSENLNQLVSRGMDSAFIGFLVAGQFVTVGYYPFMWVHLALAVSLRNIIRGKMAGVDGAR